MEVVGLGQISYTIGEYNGGESDMCPVNNKKVHVPSK